MQIRTILQCDSDEDNEELRGLHRLYNEALIRAWKVFMGRMANRLCDLGLNPEDFTLDMDVEHFESGSTVRIVGKLRDKGKRKPPEAGGQGELPALGWVGGEEAG